MMKDSEAWTPIFHELDSNQTVVNYMSSALSQVGYVKKAIKLEGLKSSATASKKNKDKQSHNSMSMLTLQLLNLTLPSFP